MRIIHVLFYVRLFSQQSFEVVHVLLQLVSLILTITGPKPLSCSRLFWRYCCRAIRAHLTLKRAVVRDDRLQGF